jgi:CMP-N,N'-diacetyllegionaminic acid synthase
LTPRPERRSGVAIVAVVPARGGSKGVPRKNLAIVAGMTLLARACDVARRCPSIEIVVVTTDDPEIELIARSVPVDIVVRRPDHLATDEASGADAWAHAWEATERTFDRRFDASVLLQPTSPTRTIDDVESTLQLLRTTGASTCLTVSPVPGHYNPDKLLRINDDGAVRPVVPGAVPNRRRQAVQPAYWLNGHCYAARRDSFLADRSVVRPDTRALVLDRPVANIDEPDDLVRAAEILGSEGVTDGA